MRGTVRDGGFCWQLGKPCVGVLGSKQVPYDQSGGGGASSSRQILRAVVARMPTATHCVGNLGQHPPSKEFVRFPAPGRRRVPNCFAKPRILQVWERRTNRYRGGQQQWFARETSMISETNSSLLLTRMAAGHGPRLGPCRGGGHVSLVRSLPHPRGCVIWYSFWLRLKP